MAQKHQMFKENWKKEKQRAMRDSDPRLAGFYSLEIVPTLKARHATWLRQWPLAVFRQIFEI